MDRQKVSGDRVANSGGKEAQLEAAIDAVRRALQGLQYGEVILKVQGGKVVWVDRYERERVG